MIKIPVFLSSDDNYACFVATTIASICDNTKSFCDFYVLDGGITEENQEKILELKNKFNNFSIEFIKIDIKKEFEYINYKNTGYISISTYNRFLIPKLKPEIKKAIYLDVDLVLIDDIKKLFEIDLESYALGAVEDYNSDIRNRDLIKSDHIYFNAGVLLLDLEKWRKNNIAQRLFEIERKYHDKLTFSDQDVLNIYFEKNYKQLKNCFNAIEKAQHYTIIRHFAGRVKPWQIESNSKSDFVRNSELFWKYAKLTPFLDEIKSKKLNETQLRLLKVKIVQDKLNEKILKEKQKLIPKRIFYVWGYNEPIKESVQKCIDSWKKYLPEYEIIQINERSVDYFDFQKELEANKWFKTVYDRKMWAFVADYVRIKTLYNNGGIYFDTDVEVVKNFDIFLQNTAFVGIQDSSLDGTKDYVEPAILGSQKGNRFLEEVLSCYDKLIWEMPIYTMPDIFHYFLKKYNIYPFPKKDEQKIIKLDNITLYPEKYFIPFRYEGKYTPDCIQNETCSIHWWGASWTSLENLFFLKNKHLYPIDYINDFWSKNGTAIERQEKVKHLWANKLKAKTKA